MTRWHVGGLLLAGLPFLLGTLAVFAQEKPVELEWLKPPALRPGDTIMFVAPAGPPERKRVETAAQQLRDRGFSVIVPDNLFRKQGYLAGSDDERADELNRAIRDPKVHAIFPVRGGYGLMRILDRVDYAALRKQPKIVTGFSDLTALHLAIARHARLITFHSPMPQAYLWREQGDYAFSADSFRRTVFAGGYAAEREGYVVELPADHPRPTRLVAGKASGRLVGGNLSLVTATLATPYAIDARGGLLFLEDTGEAPYRVDRMLAQLKLAGVLDAAAGIILGSFDKADPKETEEVLRHYCAGLRKPVVLNFPVGHTALNATLPHGARAELDADRLQLRLTENPVELR